MNQIELDLIRAGLTAFQLLSADWRRSQSDRNYYQVLSMKAFAAIKAADMLAQPPAPTITFLSPRPHQFVIGVGDDVRDYRSELIGLAAAQIVMACASRPEVSRTRDWVLGDARRADNSMRKALRVTAAAWLDDHCPLLAAEVRRIRVGRGRMLYAARAGAPRIVTQH